MSASPPARARRRITAVTRELAGRGRDIIALSILRSGAASATQFGNELISGVGSASVLAPTDPSTSTLYTDGSFITLALSRRSLAALVPDLSQAFGGRSRAAARRCGS